MLITSMLCCMPMMLAQKSDPVVMTINKQPVTWSEFYYSYAKNGDLNTLIDQKSIDEYIPMYVDYRLKVEAAKDARLDTLKSFNTEYRQYRDVQLTPFLVDTAYIETVARDVYEQAMASIPDHELRRAAHIFIALPQEATADMEENARRLADSLYAELQNGADFRDLAVRYTNDVATIQSGGELNWVGKGMVTPKFEEALFSMKTDEISKPVRSELGYHIIKLYEIRILGDFAEQRPFIIEELKRQGIEEDAAKQTIERRIAESDNKLTREDVLTEVLNSQKDNLPLQYLVKEYHDGLLMFEVSQRRIWEPAQTDTLALEQFYQANKKKYAWTEPHYKGHIYHYKKKSDKKKIVKLLKKTNPANYRQELRKSFNADSVTVNIFGPYLCKPGDNIFIDDAVFNLRKATPRKNFPYFGVYGKQLKQPESYKDVKAAVVSDYQDALAENWLESLRKKYPVEINNELIHSLYNQELKNEK